MTAMFAARLRCVIATPLRVAMWIDVETARTPHRPPNAPLSPPFSPPGLSEATLAAGTGQAAEVDRRRGPGRSVPLDTTDASAGQRARVSIASVSEARDDRAGRGTSSGCRRSPRDNAGDQPSWRVNTTRRARDRSVDAANSAVETVRRRQRSGRQRRRARSERTQIPGASERRVVDLCAEPPRVRLRPSTKTARRRSAASASACGGSQLVREEASQTEHRDHWPAPEGSQPLTCSPPASPALPDYFAFNHSDGRASEEPRRRARSCGPRCVFCTSAAGGDVEAVLECGDRLQDLQRIEPKVSDEIVFERGLDGPTADVLQNLDDGVVNDGGRWGRHR